MFYTICILFKTINRVLYKGIIASFVRAPKRKAMKTFEASFFSLMLVNLIERKYSTFSYCYTALGAGCSTKQAAGGFFRRVL